MLFRRARHRRFTGQRKWESAIRPGLHFRLMLTRGYWLRHPEPWAKTDKGKRRRASRRFIRSHDNMESNYVQSDIHPAGAQLRDI